MLLSSGIDMATSLATIEITKSAHGLVKAFVGIHPSEAQEAAGLGWFEGALREAAGAGEIGMDPRYSEVGTGSAQRTTFVKQLEGAERAEKPIQVHSRGAEKECIQVLTSYRLERVLMHWFEGEADLREVGDRGYFVSFGPAILYSKKLQRMASSLKPELILTESDGPVTFRPLGGAQGPSLIPTVVFKLAELWRVTFSQAEELVMRNGLSYLNMSEKT
jgi:TatD DNase family protein